MTITKERTGVKERKLTSLPTQKRGRKPAVLIEVPQEVSKEREDFDYPSYMLSVLQDNSASLSILRAIEKELNHTEKGRVQFADLGGQQYTISSHIQKFLKYGLSREEQRSGKSSIPNTTRDNETLMKFLGARKVNTDQQALALSNAFGTSNTYAFVKAWVHSPASALLFLASRKEGKVPEVVRKHLHMPPDLIKRPPSITLIQRLFEKAGIEIEPNATPVKTTIVKSSGLRKGSLKKDQEVQPTEPSALDPSFILERPAGSSSDTLEGTDREAFPETERLKPVTILDLNRLIQRKQDELSCLEAARDLLLEG